MNLGQDGKLDDSYTEEVRMDTLEEELMKQDLYDKLMGLYTMKEKSNSSG